tara:strand:- start:29 stop:805 length:777 start_codon:yes stop_codon:yes gene_type:complete
MFGSILISNYNKEKYIQKCIDSCLSQTYSDFEIIIGDNESTDNSLKILENYNLKNIHHIKKKFESPALNQLNILKDIFDKSKGDIIFLLDSDDYFEKIKLEKIINIFNNDKLKNIVCDVPRIINFDNSIKEFKYKVNVNFKKRWPTIFPTSCIAVRRNSFKEFLKFAYIDKYPDLEIDFRLICYFYNIKRELFIELNNLTNYVQATNSITSKYKKYTSEWWKKRVQAFNFLIEILNMHKINHYKSIDYIVTKIVNKYI